MGLRSANDSRVWVSPGDRLVQEKRVMKSSRPGALSLGLCAVILYLAANAVTGRQGLISYIHLQQQERDLVAEQADLTEQSGALKARIHALADNSLDLDLLEDEARRQIGAAAPDEIVFDVAQNGNASTP
jgi:cell division protein FtsB